MFHLLLGPGRLTASYVEVNGWKEQQDCMRAGRAGWHCALASSACVIVTHGVLDRSGKSTKTAHRRCNNAMSKCILHQRFIIIDRLFVHGHSRTHRRHAGLACGRLYAPTATAIGKSNTKRRDLINTNVGRDLWIRGQSLIFSRS
jgi:hypothetical protein